MAGANRSLVRRHDPAAAHGLHLVDPRDDLADKVTDHLADDRPPEVTDNLTATLTADLADEFSHDSDHLADDLSAEVTHGLSAEVTDHLILEVADNLAVEVTHEVVPNLADNLAAEVTDEVIPEVADNADEVVLDLADHLADAEMSADLADDLSHDLTAELADLRPHLVRAPLIDVVAALERLLPPPRSPAAHDERIRIHHTSDLGFHPGEILAVDLNQDIATVTTSLLGLCGLESPLPLYLLDDADRDDDPSAALRGLLDVVHHRLFSLLLRALRERDLPESLHRDDRWLLRLLALFGLRECSAMPRPVLLELLPVFAAGARTPALLAAAVRLALGDHLGEAAVRVDPWTGGWLPIDPDQHTRLGESTAILGDTAVLGTEIFHPAGAATIVIGPLAPTETREFLPGGHAHARIAAICRRFTTIHLDLAIELRSRPPALLDERRLGEDFWLGDDPDSPSRHHVPLDCPRDGLLGQQTRIESRDDLCDSKVG